ncbi:hypothetical protein TELCIR_16331 [Teladorsagia circumcincta]|uniref:Uncharacterized protein n=1 Tax=Teladorsagia circumcincta TaxID=45464 RepID=A0A2G9TVS4_TELCI|nr:hypothetical protein TELCIR_16331 [Teladorsagia circumcincta]
MFPIVTLRSVDENQRNRSESEKGKKRPISQTVLAKWEISCNNFSLNCKELIRLAAESGNGSGYEGSPAQSGSYVASPAQQHWAYQTKNQGLNPSYSESPADQSMQDEEMEEGEDVEGGEDSEIGAEQSQVKSTAQKRRDRRMRMKNMLSVMKRGRFHEIQEMQREFVARTGPQ